MKPEKFYSLFLFMSSFAGCLVVGIYVPYLIHLGLTKADIFLINAIFWLAISSSEIITGMLADGKSRAWSVRTGLLLSVASSVIYAGATFVHAKWQVMTIALVAEVLEGIGMSFMSGAQQAWLSDALIKHGHKDKDEQARIFARTAKWDSLGMLLGGSLSFIIINYGYTFSWATRALMILAAWLLCKLVMNGDGEPVVRTSELKSLRDSWHSMTTSRSLRWAAVAGMILGFVLTFNLTWVPHFNPSADGITANSLLTAFLWAMINLGLFFGNRLVERSKYLRLKQTLAIPLALTLAGLGLVLLGYMPNSLVAIPFIILHEMGRGMFHPLMNGFIYSRVGSSFKATYGSLQSMVARFGFALVLFAGWILMRGVHANIGDGVIWPTAGLALVLCSVLLWSIRPRTEA